MRHADVYVVGVTSSNANAAMAFEFLYRVVAVLKSYFGGALNEAAVRANIYVIYELLDEMLDFGHPQVTETDVLRLSVAHDGATPTSASAFAITATGQVAHRREGIKYRRNEVFLDVVESVNLLISAKGTLLRADVAGRITMKAFLSGMPECKLGLNDAHADGAEIDDVKFHQCVRLGKFDADRTISFIPPDGEFELARYRCHDRVALPFRVHPHYRDLGRTRIEIKVAVKAAFDAQLFATGVVIRLPCPENTARVVTTGNARFDANAKALVWRIARFQGGQELSLAAEVTLLASTSDTAAWSRPPIEMDFQLPMHTASGLKVRFLKVFEKSNYPATKWVRYITKAGSYQLRF